MPFRPDPKLQSSFRSDSSLNQQSEDKGLLGSIDGAVKGFAKGVASIPFEATQLGRSMAYGIGKGMQKIPFAPIQSYGKKVTDFQEQGKMPAWMNFATQQPEVLKPKGSAEKFGYGAEQIGEFFLPTGASTKSAQLAGKILPKIETGLTKLDKIIKGTVKLGAKSAVSATEFAGKTALQTGDLKATTQSGLIGAFTPPVVKGITTVAKKIAPVAASVMAEMTGKEPQHIIRAFKNPVVVAKRMAEKVIPLRVREKAIKSLDSFKQSYGKTFDEGLVSLQKDIKRWGVMFNVGVRKENQALIAEGWLSDVRKGLVKELRNLRVSVIDNGKKLDFDKLNSSVTSGGERKNLQMIWDTINEQSFKNMTPKDVQAVAARINSLINFEKGTKTINSLAASKMHTAYGEFIKDLYPDLYKIRKDFSASQQIYEGIDEILRSVKNEIANPIAVTGAAKKLSNVFAEDNDAYINALKRLEKATGVDLLNDLAATEFKNLMPRRLGSVMMQASAVAGGFIYNPLIFPALFLFSPKVMGKLTTGAGKAAPYTTEALQSIPKLFMPSLND